VVVVVPVSSLGPGPKVIVSDVEEVDRVPLARPFDGLPEQAATVMARMRTASAAAALRWTDDVNCTDSLLGNWTGTTQAPLPASLHPNRQATVQQISASH
jgi:hypothetical protein